MLATVHQPIGVICSETMKNIHMARLKAMASSHNNARATTQWYKVNSVQNNTMKKTKPNQNKPISMLLIERKKKTVEH